MISHLSDIAKIVEGITSLITLLILPVLKRLRKRQKQVARILPQVVRPVLLKDFDNGSMSLDELEKRLDATIDS